MIFLSAAYNENNQQKIANKNKWFGDFKNLNIISVKVLEDIRTKSPIFKCLKILYKLKYQVKKTIKIYFQENFFKYYNLQIQIVFYTND